MALAQPVARPIDPRHLTLDPDSDGWWMLLSAEVLRQALDDCEHREFCVGAAVWLLDGGWASSIWRSWLPATITADRLRREVVKRTSGLLRGVPRMSRCGGGRRGPSSAPPSWPCAGCCADTACSDLLRRRSEGVDDRAVLVSGPHTALEPLEVPVHQGLRVLDPGHEPREVSPQRG